MSVQNGPKELLELGVADTIKSLEADLGAGISQAEAETRLRRYGYNEIPDAKRNMLAEFARKFWGLTAWMLEFIMVISWFLGKHSDFYIVGGLLIFNAIISFAQEQHASNAVELLKKRLQINARVLRGGIWKKVPARELVPGDIVRIRVGDFVPADVKIASGGAGADQSALTGESAEVEKNPGDILYSGSKVKRGEATGVVVLTGVKTFFGKTAQLVQIARPRMHVEEMISGVVKWLLAIVAAVLVVTFAFSILDGVNPLEILPLMLVLLLGAIPVALPAMFTVSMAMGATELVRRGVLITRLSALDDAASMDTLCIDKTGTLTYNRLSLEKVIPLNKHSEGDVLLYGMLASQEANYDPIDSAFLAAAKKGKITDSSFMRLSFTPFDPKTRRTDAVVKKDGLETRVMKGSASVISEACALNADMKREVFAYAEEYARKGYRTIAVAKSEPSKTPVLVGLAALDDPPRQDSNRLLSELGGMGVSVKMLTGDAQPIAQETAKAVGLQGNIEHASVLRASEAGDSAKTAELIEKSAGFAEVYPEDKYAVIRFFQSKGHIVGMTGDGVNDAPSLRQAEVGIATSNATDVAKGAASAVLTDEGLTGIPHLVEVGRMTFQRVNTWVLNKIARTVLKTCFVVIAYFATGTYVISSSTMLLILFMTDFVKISLSTDNVRIPHKPGVWDVKGMAKLAAALGIIMVFETLGLLWLGMTYFSIANDSKALNTFTFEILLYFGLFSIFVVRERGHFWDSIPSKTLLAAVILDMIIAAAMATYGLIGLKPIPLAETAVVFAYSLIFSLIINDLLKNAVLKRIFPQQNIQ